jgi:hypothetical protein
MLHIRANPSSIKGKMVIKSSNLTRSKKEEQPLPLNQVTATLFNVVASQGRISKISRSHLSSRKSSTKRQSKCKDIQTMPTTTKSLLTEKAGTTHSSRDRLKYNQLQRSRKKQYRRKSSNPKSCVLRKR